MEEESYSELSTQIERTIKAIEKKLAESPDPTLSSYLQRYQAAKKLIDAGTAESVSADDFRRIRYCARGYLETTSNWDQEFLHAMGETDRLLAKG